MKRPHIADAETNFWALNVPADFCEVDGCVVPFDIARDLSHEMKNYARAVRARGEKVLRVSSVVSGVVGNAGKGIVSGVSLAGGWVLMTHGASNVFVEGCAVVRHEDLCEMNGGR